MTRHAAIWAGGFLYQLGVLDYSGGYGAFLSQLHISSASRHRSHSCLFWYSRLRRVLVGRPATSPGPRGTRLGVCIGSGGRKLPRTIAHIIF
jgi:hypothetical protein